MDEVSCQKRPLRAISEEPYDVKAESRTGAYGERFECLRAAESRTGAEKDFSARAAESRTGERFEPARRRSPNPTRRVARALQRHRVVQL